MGSITGLNFMAKKQFSMEKRLGTSVCADISQHPLKNQYIFFLYEKITIHVFFLHLFFLEVSGSNLASENSFWTNIEKQKLFFQSNI